MTADDKTSNDRGTTSEDTTQGANVPSNSCVTATTTITGPRATSSPNEIVSPTLPVCKESNSPSKSSHYTDTSGITVMDTENDSSVNFDHPAASTDWSASNSNVVTPPTARKKGWPRGRKRRCLPKDAPKAPLSGYMLFMAEQRELLRHSACPPTFAELAKIVAQQWGVLDATVKQRFLEASDVEKERYQKEMAVYTKTHAYKQFMEQQKLQSPGSVAPSVLPAQHTTPTLTSPQQENKRPRKEVQHTAPVPDLNNTNNTSNINNASPSPSKINGLSKTEDEMVNYSNGSPLEIPIFTDQFLRHNKAREAELRQLRKSNSDYEEQNALLQKHIESIKLSADKHESETAELKRKSDSLNQHLASLRADLTKAFATTPAPGWTSPPTPSNVDEYLMSLHAALTASPPATQSRTMQMAVQQIVTALVLH